MTARTLFVLLSILASTCFGFVRFAESKVPQEEVDALKQIASTLGATSWKFNGDSCQIVSVVPEPPKRVETDINCDCSFENNTVCHIVRIELKRYNLPGMLPPDLVKLHYLQEIDLCYNYLNGTIPREWGSTQLKTISILANRLSGEIPKELGNITSLLNLTLEANQFSGTLPPELGNLINLRTLLLSSNQLTGKLPNTFAKFTNLTDFRINDNSFNGSIPGYIQNWRQLTRLEMHASGLQGPIPSEISLLHKLTILRISDIKGANQGFPKVSNMAGITKLILRNCNISGEIPAYIWNMRYLHMLDVSYNKLVGEIPNDINGKSLKYIFLTANMLSGNVPDTILREGTTVDLSYNSLTYRGPEQPACRKNVNFDINLFRSNSMDNNMSVVLPCSKKFNCPRYRCSLHVNCGGDSLNLKEKEGKILYEGDAFVQGGTAKSFDSGNYWGLSSTGDFLDDNDYQNTRYTETLTSSNLSEPYTTARRAPISLTYFSYCLENGIYTVKLHFAEIQFTNDKTYSSTGRRLFDIYIQDKLVWKDFNIEDEAQGAQKPVMKQFNASVTNSSLDIRFYWAGKGTTRIPDRGVYGPLISAISVDPNFKRCSNGRKKGAIAYIIAGGVIICSVFLLSGILWWKGCLGGRTKRKKSPKALDIRTGTFTLKQIRTATNNFDPGNKIGEGGFGPVYKGVLLDGTLIAVKQLSSKSNQGNREFLNEMGMISCLQHPNLVKLHGCCIEADQLLLVYEYMENNNLARALFGMESSQLILDWPTRVKICVGIARGLAFLHEESRFKIVHRDIKATNVLLDKDLNPKISDFGLAKLGDEEKTHISTRVAGTIGYMAPEYALWGYLTYKADVYSLGVVVFEIVSGKNNNKYIPSGEFVCLLDLACRLHQSGNLMELVDQKLGSEVNKEEAERIIRVGLLCTNASPSLRPTMSEVVSLLDGKTTLPDIIPGPTDYSEDLRFKAMRDLYQHGQSRSSSGNQMQNSSRRISDIDSSSTSGHDTH